MEIDIKIEGELKTEVENSFDHIYKIVSNFCYFININIIETWAFSEELYDIIYYNNKMSKNYIIYLKSKDIFNHDLKIIINDNIYLMISMHIYKKSEWVFNFKNIDVVDNNGEILYVII